MKIAIIGAGIAGNTLAHHLYAKHDISLFESQSHIGGHTHTHDIEIGGQKIAVDTGFIVFNDRTYPEFIQLIEQHQVAWQPSDMSFSVHCENTGFEYNGTTLNSLFAQRRNLISPAFYGMIADILRFNRESLALLESPQEITLGEYLTVNKYRKKFINQYIVPMGSAIWSTDAAQMMQFPARFFVRFFHHHGMLSVNNRPQWRTITGGSREYVKAITKPFAQRIFKDSPVQKVERHHKYVRLYFNDARAEEFDYVFFACHSDQALQLLSAPTQDECEILGAIPYQANTAVLHTDKNLMPKRPLAWAAWNYHLPREPLGKVAVTYNMNILQAIDYQDKFENPLCVTLNYTQAINPQKIIKTLHYMHPVYTVAGAQAQMRHAEICGKNHTGFAGAYWRNGFHEDGVKSALDALRHFELHLASPN